MSDKVLMRHLGFRAKCATALADRAYDTLWRDRSSPNFPHTTRPMNEVATDMISMEFVG